MRIFQISIHQFRRAIAKLKNELNIFFKSVKQVATTTAKKVATSVNNVTPSANTDRQTTSKNSNQSDSPNLRSNLDQISLSDISDKPKPVKLRSRVKDLPEEEREKFLSFAMNKVNELPKRPTLPSKWIQSNFDDLYSEFKLSSAPETEQATQSKQFAEWYELMRQLGHAVGQKVENGVQMIEMRGGMWSTYERKSQSWTLEYLRKCAGGK